MDADKNRERQTEELGRLRRRVTELEAEIGLSPLYVPAFDAMPIPATLIDARGTVVDINRAFLDYARAHVHEVCKKDRLGRPVLDFADQSDGRRFLERLLRIVLEEGESGRFTWRTTNMEGGKVFVDLHGEPFKDAEGRVIGALLMRRDVTPEERTRQRQSAVSWVREAVVKMEGSDDLKPVLEGMRDCLRELDISFDHCGVNLIDPDSDLPRFQGLVVTEVGIWQQDPLPEKAQEVLLAIWKEKEVAYRPDLEAEDPYGEVGHIRDNYLLPVRSVVDVPFVRGTLAVNSVLPHAFSEEDIETLRELAKVLSEGATRLEDLRVLEVRNRELEREIAEREKAEEGLHESQRVLSTLMSNLPGMAYRCRNDRDWTMEFVSEGSLELTGYTSSELVHNRRVSFGSLIHPDDREMVWNGIQTSLGKGQSFQLIYRIICIQGEEKWVWEQGRTVPTGDSEQVVLEGFITDITKQRRTEETLRVFSRNSIRLQEEERRSVARELHDGVNQILTAARFSLYSTGSEAGRLKEAERLMDEAIQEVRRISRHLRPRVLDDLGLLPAVRSLGKGFAERFEVEVIVEEEDFPVEISEEVESTIYRVVQEALNNAGKHADANWVRLLFSCAEGALRVRIEDDGKGFEIEKVRVRGGGMGLNNMEERASLTGGTLHIDSSFGEGTVVSLRLPVEGRGRYGNE